MSLINLECSLSLFLLFFNQVCTNGHISFGVATPYIYIIYADLFDEYFFAPLVAPYLIDIDHSFGVGNISYEVHTVTTSKSLLSKVNSLINEHMGTQFSGEWMLVAEWKDVPRYLIPDTVSFSFLTYSCMNIVLIFNFHRPALFRQLSLQIIFHHLLCLHINVETSTIMMH